MGKEYYQGMRSMYDVIFEQGDTLQDVGSIMIKGKAWIFGDDVDTDVIIPGKYLRTRDRHLWAEHVMEGIDPQFASRVGKGDIIVAGENFGSGSSREQAPLALKEAGVAAIPLSVFCADPFPHKLIRLCFAKQESTLLAAAERLNTL